MSSREALSSAKRWVVKIGSSLVTNDGEGLDLAAIESWCEQCASLREDGVELVLVCSGAVAEGLVRLGLPSRPAGLAELQATAAVGQMGVVQAWEQGFSKHGISTAQVLLTHDDLANQSRYLNARNTLQTLISFGVIAVINENDTVAIEEISLGDNDSLGALVAGIVDAELFLILTDQEGLYDADPRSNPDAKLIPHADVDDPRVLAAAGGGGVLGRGGMRTKILAAQNASQSGCVTAICSGREPNVMARLRAGEEIGTVLVSDKPSLPAQKRWLASQTQVAGSVVVGSGAEAKVVVASAGVMPSSLVSVDGGFSQGDLIAVYDQSGMEIARGLANYSSEQTQKIVGLDSDQVRNILGGVQHLELIQLDNLVVFP